MRRLIMLAFLLFLAATAYATCPEVASDCSNPAQITDATYNNPASYSNPEFFKNADPTRIKYDVMTAQQLNDVPPDVLKKATSTQLDALLKAIDADPTKRFDFTRADPAAATAALNGRFGADINIAGATSLVFSGGKLNYGSGSYDPRQFPAAKYQQVISGDTFTLVAKPGAELPSASITGTSFGITPEGSFYIQPPADGTPYTVTVKTDNAQGLLFPLITPDGQNSLVHLRPGGSLTVQNGVIDATNCRLQAGREVVDGNFKRYGVQSYVLYPRNNGEQSTYRDMVGSQQYEMFAKTAGHPLFIGTLDAKPPEGYTGSSLTWQGYGDKAIIKTHGAVWMQQKDLVVSSTDLDADFNTQVTLKDGSAGRRATGIITVEDARSIYRGKSQASIFEQSFVGNAEKIHIDGPKGEIAVFERKILMQNVLSAPLVKEYGANMKWTISRDDTGKLLMQEDTFGPSLAADLIASSKTLNGAPLVRSVSDKELFLEAGNGEGFIATAGLGQLISFPEGSARIIDPNLVEVQVGKPFVDTTERITELNQLIDEAKKDGNTALARDLTKQRDYVDYTVASGNIQLARLQGDVEGAVMRGERWLKEHPDTEVASLAKLSLGELYRDLGTKERKAGEYADDSFDKAVRYLAEARNDKTQYDKATLALGETLMRQGKNLDARGLYGTYLNELLQREKASSSAPIGTGEFGAVRAAQSMVRLGLASTYLDTTQSGALKWSLRNPLYELDQAIAADPNNGLAYEMRRQLETVAIRTMREAVSGSERLAFQQLDTDLGLDNMALSDGFKKNFLPALTSAAMTGLPDDVRNNPDAQKVAADELAKSLGYASGVANLGIGRAGVALLTNYYDQRAADVGAASKELQSLGMGMTQVLDLRAQGKSWEEIQTMDPPTLAKLYGIDPAKDPERFRNIGQAMYQNVRAAMNEPDMQILMDKNPTEQFKFEKGEAYGPELQRMNRFQELVLNRFSAKETFLVLAPWARTTGSTLIPLKGAEAVALNEIPTVAGVMANSVGKIYSAAGAPLERMVASYAPGLLPSSLGSSTVAGRAVAATQTQIKALVNLYGKASTPTQYLAEETAKYVVGTNLGLKTGIQDNVFDDPAGARSIFNTAWNLAKGSTERELWKEGRSALKSLVQTGYRTVAYDAPVVQPTFLYDTNKEVVAEYIASAPSVVEQTAFAQRIADSLRNYGDVTRDGGAITLVTKDGVSKTYYVGAGQIAGTVNGKQVQGSFSFDPERLELMNTAMLLQAGTQKNKNAYVMGKAKP